MSTQNPVFIPGPTNMPEVLRRACDIPTMDHRSAAFPEILHPALEGVKRVLKSTEAEVFIFPATGTAGWEAAICNTLCAGDTVLAARNGMFSHKWIDMCNRHGLKVIQIDVPWGEGLPVDAFADALKADTDHKIKAVLATHNETATGVVSDVAGVRKALDAANHPALYFVDGVSSIGSMPFEFDGWGVDIAVTGSQKGFMLPAGLAIIGVSPKAMAAIDAADLPRTFLDIRDMKKGYEANAYPYTPSVGLLNGLKTACDMIEAEGLENVFARHARIADGVRAAVKAWGLDLCAVSPDLYSNTVSAIQTPEGFDAGRIVSHASTRYGVAFGAGLGDVAGKVFRIGHLGMLTDVMALSGIATAEMVMVDLGLDITLGSGVAAAQEVYRQSAAAMALAAE
ncbi:aminotransferase class V-fold PLP-dependent enzyme [Rhodobacteraceae bacterium N5(2021)]|uniref:Aminotransferase class V-fold PLP-dependent enzyme n=1 Tax=Gymnodinialimonas phycosphaerae TaxID=2841589 RepID=A0A975YHS0_9RHOB|nr:L-aspartate--glyoxylate aminotransferase BhcA [Gymnodinialimonas phycosphaerae]MBY4893056.1 aminotransferase class V-fold PLP-dependent enzyme [Gymnodinialimonas phycosphaerae]